MKLRGSSARTVTIPAGRYWVGDPGYLLDDADWWPWLTASGAYGKTGKRRDEAMLGKTPSGHFVLAYSTAFGDGMYWDNEGCRYPVDAGMLGIVPAAYAPDGFDGRSRTGRPLMHLVSFDRAVTCSVLRRDHTIRFGGVRIRTCAGSLGD